MTRQYQAQTQLLNLPTIWDALAFILILSIFVLLAFGAQQMATPYALGDNLPVSLDASALPGYTLRTVLRMSIALCISLLFSFLFGTLAAKYKRAEQIIIPAIDILQSIPILGFLSISIIGFIHLFPGSLLGPECAAIFAIFTSQAWNMALSIYQSLKTVPTELQEAANLFRLNAWQRFWRVEIPFATPSLLWNTMISLSGGWFFVVASEAISVSNQKIMLPGIGSYIAIAIEQKELSAVGLAILAMFLVILVYDQLFFKPLLKWAEKFRSNNTEEDDGASSWVYTLFQRALWFRRFANKLKDLFDLILHGLNLPEKTRPIKKQKVKTSKFSQACSIGLILSICLAGLFSLEFIFQHIPLSESIEVIFLGFITGVRVMVMIALCSLLWIPVGIWVGLRPKATRIVQPIAQFLAAFPANLLFPIVVYLIVRYHLSVEIWTTPLMVLGTQWYILFNVIVGASMLPKDLQLAAKNFNVKGWLWWQRLALPAIFPYFVTGALAAAGGAWNASITAEVINWGDNTLTATGLGAYIAEQTTSGDFPRIALGIGVMCLYVLLINRFFWQKLYDKATTRYQIE